MIIAETRRLSLRHMTPLDASFLCRLLNEPSWMENIGDRGVRTPEEAEGYIRDKVLAMYETHGFGMYVVEIRRTGRAIGVCGLVRRESLPGTDIGFALLPEYWHMGYAFEAASAVMAYARGTLHLPPLLAITSQANTRSGELLLKLGFKYKGLICLDPESDEIKLYQAAS